MRLDINPNEFIGRPSFKDPEANEKIAMQWAQRRLGVLNVHKCFADLKDNKPLLAGRYHEDTLKEAQRRYELFINKGPVNKYGWLEWEEMLLPNMKAV